MHGENNQKMSTCGEVKPDGDSAATLLTNSLVVFQCESCRAIVGDATNWVAATEPLRAFTLNTVTDCIVDGETLHHSNSTHDAGSSYSILTCRICKTELGRRYLTTPRHLDYLRDNFTLLVAMVTSYQLGSANVRGVSKVTCQEPTLLLHLAEQCIKIQHLIVTMNDRLCNVEHCLRGDSDGE